MMTFNRTIPCQQQYRYIIRI